MGDTNTIAATNNLGTGVALVASKQAANPTVAEITAGIKTKFNKGRAHINDLYVSAKESAASGITKSIDRASKTFPGKAVSAYYDLTIGNLLEAARLLGVESIAPRKKPSDEGLIERIKRENRELFQGPTTRESTSALIKA